MGDEQTKVRGHETHEAMSDHVGEPSGAAEVSKAKEMPPVAAEGEGEVSDSIFAEFWLFLKEEKKWWLAPLVLVLMALSAVIIFAEGSAIAPFIYTIF